MKKRTDNQRMDFIEENPYALWRATVKLKCGIILSIRQAIDSAMDEEERGK